MIKNTLIFMSGAVTGFVLSELMNKKDTRSYIVVKRYMNA